MISSEKKAKAQNNLILAVIALFWFAQYVYIPFQTVFLDQIGVNASFMGIIIGAYGGFQLALRFPIGLMADIKNSHKNLIFVSLVCAGLASALRFLFPTGLSFFFASLLSGIASSMWMCYILLFDSMQSSDNQRMVMGQTVLFGNVGIMAGIIFSSLFYAKIGMKGLSAASAISSIPAIILMLFVKKTTSNNKKISLHSLLKVLKDKDLLFFSSVTIVQQGIQAALAMSFASQRLNFLGASKTVIGLSSMFYMTVALISSYFFSSKKGSKISASFYMPLIFVCLFLYCLIIGFSSSIPIIFASQFFPGISNGILMPLLQSEAMANIPIEKRSSAMGFFQSMYSVGMILFPIAAGYVMRSVSWEIALLILGITTIPCIVLSIAKYKKKLHKHI